MSRVVPRTRTRNCRNANNSRNTNAGYRLLGSPSPMMMVVGAIPIVMMVVVMRVVIPWPTPIIIVMMMVVMVIIAVAPILGELHPWVRGPVGGVFARRGVGRLELFDGVRNRLQQFGIRLRARCRLRGRRRLTRREGGHSKRACQTRNFLIHVPPHIHHAITRYIIVGGCGAMVAISPDARGRRRHHPGLDPRDIPDPHLSAPGRSSLSCRRRAARRRT